MIGHRIVSALIAWLKMAITGLIIYSLMMLLLHDVLTVVRHFSEVFFFSLVNFLFFIFSSALYFVAILIPMSFIDKKAFENSGRMQLMNRYLPIATILFAGVTLIIFAIFSGLRIPGKEVYIVVLNMYNTFFFGLFFFIQVAKKRESKLNF